MISELETSPNPFDRDRMVVVMPRADDRAMLDVLRSRYPDWDVTPTDSFLAAIAELAHRPARAVVADADRSMLHLDDAVAGLREAAGTETKVILCCTPANEPATRRAAKHGADDYVLRPLDGAEVDTAIGYPRPPFSKDTPAAHDPSVSVAELDAISEALDALSGKPKTLLEKNADLIRAALGARGALIVVEGTLATSGHQPVHPILTAPLQTPRGSIGQITLGERIDGPYTPADTAKLSHYANLIGHLLEAASRQRQWHQLAMTDECSGLPNRRFLYRKLREILAQAAEQRLSVTVLLFDVDNFKRYNDTYGHHAGDEIIRRTGRLFREHCRDQDVVTRYGGDEFAVVFWDPKGSRVAGSRPPDSALTILERFQQALRAGNLAPHAEDAGEGHLTISGGMATFPWDGASAPALLAQADQALLAAKRAGKNRVFIFGQQN